MEQCNPIVRGTDLRERKITPHLKKNTLSSSTGAQVQRKLKNSLHYFASFRAIHLIYMGDPILYNPQILKLEFSSYSLNTVPKRGKIPLIVTLQLKFRGSMQRIPFH